MQRFAELPTYTEVNPGEDALLKCRISDKKGVCSWQKDNKVGTLVTLALLYNTILTKIIKNFSIKYCYID